jgi:adenosine 3'-phospho 5'-phosphosulfate transporter B2
MEATPLNGNSPSYSNSLYTQWEKSPALRLGVCCGGVVLMLGTYGFLQERIMAAPYVSGTVSEYFKYTVFLVFLNRVVSAAFAFFMVIVKGESMKNGPPLWKYAAVSVSNVLATTCQYEALKFVSFPVQMLGKSSKMVPVMGWGIAISGKSYKLIDWIIALAVTGGCTIFLVGGNILSNKEQDAGKSEGLVLASIGLCLMLGYLACDGFTSMFQEKIFKDHNVTPYNQMLYVNLFSILVSCAALVTFGGFPQSFAFAARHPTFLVDALLLSCSATFGQVFIYSTIFWFGALVFAATMNLRQLVSILISVGYYAHPVTLVQWLGVALCFSGLFLKTYLGHLAYKEKEKKDGNETKATP